MSKIICFEKWDYDCGTLNQISFEFDDSITINQISKLADRILNDYYDESETNDEIELDEVYIYNKCYEFCKEQRLMFNTIKPDITVSLDTQKVHIKEEFYQLMDKPKEYVQRFRSSKKNISLFKSCKAYNWEMGNRD